MSDPKQYDDVIGMLTDQCHQYAVENARLKAENEKYRRVFQGEKDWVLMEPGEHARLKQQVERLTKAGDDMYSWLGVCGRHNNSTGDDWLRAKKGLPSLTKQWEIEKRNRAAKNAAKEGKGQP
jgi:hypothetical protein